MRSGGLYTKRNSVEAAHKLNAATYEAFLRQLLDQITGPIILIEDGASYHRSQAVEQFRQAHASA